MSPGCCQEDPALKEAQRPQAASASTALILCLLSYLLSLLSLSRLDSCEPGLKALAAATHFQSCTWAQRLVQPSSLCAPRGGGNHPLPHTDEQSLPLLQGQ